MADNERKLSGGNMSAVSTDGKIVYKDGKPQSETIHRLLNHLESKGVSFCPKAIGFDKSGREMLSYVAGDTMEDYPSRSGYEKKLETIREAAKLLRMYHDATADFERMESDIWFLEYNGALEKEVVCHNDFAPYNVTFIDHLPVGLIDFDTACPAPRVWDIAYAVYRFVPLSFRVYDCCVNQYRDYDEEMDRAERQIFIREFLDSYGFDMDIGVYVIERLKVLVDLFDAECAKGNAAFLKMREEGHQAFYEKEIAFIKEHYASWMRV